MVMIMIVMMMRGEGVSMETNGSLYGESMIILSGIYGHFTVNYCDFMVNYGQ